MTTKEKIVMEALNLFSKNGYKGTSVKKIADAVGIKDSSLYKHFKSKQEIFDTIMLTIKERIHSMSQKFGLPEGENYEKAVEFYSELSEEGLVKFSREIFLFYLKDELISKFWRMGMMEQFQNDEVYSLFREFFLEDSIKYQTELFSNLIEKNIFKKVDPEVMAISFYTPIFFLISKYSGSKDEQEALRILDKQVSEFYHLYRI